jgi:hypothetical protein
VAPRRSMLVPSVYSLTMQMNGSPALLQRIGRLLRAKQFLVFYAIGLFVLLYVPPLLTGWLRHHRPLDQLLRENDAMLGDLWAKPGLSIALVIVGSLVAQAWLRAGYLRSLLGRLHWRPVDARQFRRLLGLMVTYELVTWGLSAAATALGINADDVTVSDRTTAISYALLFLQLVVMLVLLYADYAIVVSSVTLLQSFRRSVDTVRANRLISLLVVGLPLTVAIMSASAMLSIRGAALTILPSIVVVVVVSGAISFVVDVVLITVYIDTIQRRGSGED